jgi:hypothetical protein
MGRVTTTALDRAGIRRTSVIQVSSPLTPATAEGINDAFLVEAAKPQFSGSVTIAGWSCQLTDGTPIHASQIALSLNRRINLRDMLDPLAGTIGRIARIVGVSYSADTEEAQVTLDNSTHDFDAFIARIAQDASF